LLQKEGYEVTGVFIKAWTPPGYQCTWREDRRSAMRVCAVLDIPFITLDLEKEYKRDVVDYMIREYKEGRTPNPDVMCNKEIKFGAFLTFALKNGADFVATGHYSQKIFNFQFSIFNLKEGKDKNKDQSYFLWTLTQAELKHILFPVGHLQKQEVRKLATKFKLPQATRKDSQGLCFLGQIDMKEFLKDYIKTKKGSVLDEKGNKIGEHDGAILYTLGERHGFQVFNKKTESEPLYVVAKDVEKNTIMVTPKKLQHTQKSQGAPLVSRNTNWISGEAPKEEVKCRFRYRQEKIPCKILGNQVIFEKSQMIASGQSIVFYDDQICLGGGIIV